MKTVWNLGQQDGQLKKVSCNVNTVVASDGPPRGAEAGIILQRFTKLSQEPSALTSHWIWAIPRRKCKCGQNNFLWPRAISVGGRSYDLCVGRKNASVQKRSPAAAPQLSSW